MTIDAPDAELAAADPLLAKNEASFIVTDQSSEGSAQDLFLMGRHHGKASVTRLSKEDGSVQWHAMIDEMSHINAVAQSQAGEIFLCGDYQLNAATDIDEVFDDANTQNQYKAVVAKINTDGDLIGMAEISDSDKVGDRCKGIYYDEDSGKITGLLQTKSKIDKRNYARKYSTMLFEMDSDG